MAYPPNSAPLCSLAARGLPDWLGWLMRLLAAGALLGVLGGCSYISYSGDAAQKPKAAADGQVKMQAERANVSTPYASYIVLRSQTDSTKFLAYGASLARPATNIAGQTTTISVTFAPIENLPPARNRIDISSLASPLSPSLVYTVVDKVKADLFFTTERSAAVAFPYNHAIYAQLANANPGYEPDRAFFLAGYSDSSYLHAVDISLPSAVDKIVLTKGANKLTGSSVSANFIVTGLNSAASTRTIDWTVTEGATTVLTASTVCTGVQGASASNETCASSNPALSLVVENASRAKLSLSFIGNAGGRYQVCSKASYPASATSVPKRLIATARNFPGSIIYVPDASPVAQITTTVALITLNKAVEFDTAGSVYPKGAKVYFYIVRSGTTTPSRISPIGAKEGEIVTKPQFIFTEKSDKIGMSIVLPSLNNSTLTNNMVQKELDLKKLFTPVTGGSS